MESVRTVTLNCTTEAAKSDLTVSSVAWEVDSGQVGVSSTALASNVATASISGAQETSSVIHAVITWSDGQKLVQDIQVRVFERTQSANRDPWGLPSVTA